MFTHYLFFCISIFLLCCTATDAQQLYTTQQILSDSNLQDIPAVMNKGLTFLNTTKQNLPFVEKMEFRTETDEWDFERQEYLFRTSFNSSKRRNLQQLKTDTYRQKFSLQKRQYQSLLLYEKHKSLVQWYFLEKELESLLNKQLLLKDQKTIYEKMISNSLSFDLNNLLKAVEDLQEIQRDVLRLKHQKQQIFFQLTNKEVDPDQIRLEDPNWINIDRIQQTITNIKTSPSQKIDFAIQQIEVDFEQLEFEERELESQQLLDFVQLKYAGRDKLAIEREWSLGVGINIPTSSKGRVKENEALLQMIDEQIQLNEIESDIAEELTEDYARFDFLIKELQLIDQSISDNQLNDALEKYQQQSDFPPLSLLRIKESMLKNQRERVKIRKEIYQTYLSILRNKGAFSQHPKLNFLTDTLNGNQDN